MSWLRIQKTLLLSMLLLCSAWVVGADDAAERLGECRRGASCTESPSGQPFPPDLVTGHTVHANFTTARFVDGRGGGVPMGLPVLPHRPAPVPDPLRGPTAPAAAPGEGIVQAECVTWFDGRNLDVRPASAILPVPGVERNHFFSDMDEVDPDGVQADHADVAMQDYDPQWHVPSCAPVSGSGGADGGHGQPTDFAAIAGYFEGVEWIYQWEPPYERIERWFPSFAALVEEGDCDPALGHDFRFRGHLDFVDPNGIYHEVQEYGYVCPTPGSPPTLGLPADSVHRLFPDTYTDRYGQHGCDLYATPVDNADAPEMPGWFDLGHKCNGSVRDLVTERMWLTVTHAPVYDANVQSIYTFALVADTCSGLNIREMRTLKTALEDLDEHDLDAVDRLLDQRAAGQARLEICHDGSSFSFDDTARGRTTHGASPTSSEDLMRGNGYMFDRNSDQLGTHRTNCRHNGPTWPYNDHPGPSEAAHGPLGLLGDPWTGIVEAECYPEDHKSARIDVWVYDLDPTGGLWAGHTNGLTGGAGYVPAEPTGPDHDLGS